jgi:nicotinate-nucleotide--dimethylbenzimidazole phosphoribosyltransferase
MQPKIEEIITRIRPIDPVWIQRAEERTSQLVMPFRALGDLHEIAERSCAIQKTLEPRIDSKAVLVMAGDHGITAEGVSAYPQEVTGSMVQAFLAGGAGINAIARQVGAEVWVVDMGIISVIDTSEIAGGDHLKVSKIGRSTANFAKEPAMSRTQAIESIISGFEHATELFEKGVTVLGTGDMGIANTTSSAAIGAVVTGQDLDVMVGRGTGLNDEGLARKKAVLKKALSLNRPDTTDGLDILSKVGGFEIGGIAGLILAAAYHSRILVIDGFISTAGALIAHCLCPTVIDYCFAGHCSEEPGHRYMLNYLGLKPILDLGMRLGEGTGGALAMGVMDGALRVFREVMTFSEAGVAQ